MGSALFFAMFLYLEMRVNQPLIDLSMFKNVVFSAANFTHLLVGAALIMAIVNIPLMSDTIMGKEPLEGGLRLMRLTAMIPVGAVLGGFLCQRLGYRLPTLIGLCLAALGFYLLSRWPLDVAEPRLTRDLLIGGLGFGMVIAPIYTAVINSIKEGQKATGASLVTLMRMTGMMIGLAALTSWGTGRYAVLLGKVEELKQLPEATLGLFHDFFLAAAIICLIGLLPALCMGRHRRSL
jgi:MFS family permease